MELGIETPKRLVKVLPEPLESGPVEAVLAILLLSKADIAIELPETDGESNRIEPLEPDTEEDVFDALAKLVLRVPDRLGLFLEDPLLPLAARARDLAPTSPIV